MIREELSVIKASKDEVDQELNKLRSEYEQKLADVEDASKTGLI